MSHQEVEKYRKRTRVLHWTHTTSFILLFLTGLFIFTPGLNVLAAGGWTRIVHRVAAGVFVVIPIIYMLLNWSSSWRSVVKAFTWNSEDIGWLKAAPRYYFLGDKSSMPPQGEMNSGQKLWLLIALVTGVVFIITGGFMWFGTIAPWMLLIHDISFIIAGGMLFVHIYLGVFHPMMTESWRAMTAGKISSEYAKSHHYKWYKEHNQS
ncbi:formate dehydrogenase subunit gamma [Chloroflexota bacterium]